MQVLVESYESYTDLELEKLDPATLPPLAEQRGDGPRGQNPERLAWREELWGRG